MPDNRPDPAARRTSDEYRTWTDERVNDLAEQVRALAPLVAQVGIAQATIDQHADEMRGIRRHIRDVETRVTVQLARVEKTCTDFHEEYRQDQQSAAKQRTADRADARKQWFQLAGVVAGAIIAAGAAVAVALVTGAAG